MSITDRILGWCREHPRLSLLLIVPAIVGAVARVAAWICGSRPTPAAPAAPTIDAHAERERITQHYLAQQEAIRNKVERERAAGRKKWGEP